MGSEAIWILLELEADEDSLTGRMQQVEPHDAGCAPVAGHMTHEFSGWLGLLNALQTAVPRSPPPDR